MDLDLRQKAFFLMVLKERTKEALKLVELVPESFRGKMLELYERLAKHEGDKIRAVATEELLKLAKPKVQSYLSEVHDDWILDFLLNESPQIVALVLRYVPAERAHALLEQLPKDILKNLPRLSSTFATPSALVELLRAKFEGMFELDKPYPVVADFEFEQFCLLRARQIQQSFLEIGYREVALGLISIPENARQMVMSRLSDHDGRRVLYYVQNSKNISEQRIKRAQAHVVSKEIDTTDSTLFVKELGYVIFSKALLPRDSHDIDIIKKKISKKEAFILEEMIERHISENTEASVMAFREDVILAVKQILIQGSK